MSKITVLTIVAVLVGGGIIVGQLGDEVTTQQLTLLEYQVPTITLQNLKDGCKITTSTDALGRVYKEDVVCDVEPYLFPVASTTLEKYILEEITGKQVSVSLIGFRRCSAGGYGATSTKSYCIRTYVAQAIRNKIKTFRDGERGRLNELKEQEYQFDITVAEIEDNL